MDPGFTQSAKPCLTVLHAMILIRIGQRQFGIPIGSVSRSVGIGFNLVAAGGSPMSAILLDRVGGNAIETIDEHAGGHYQDGDTHRHPFEALTDGKKKRQTARKTPLRT